MSKVIAVCVGHSRQGDRSGAVNTAGVSEHTYNSKVGSILVRILNERGYTAVLLDKYPRTGYTAATRWVGDECARLKADLAVELHFNSAGPFAEGHEWLYWHKSTLGRKCAQAFMDTFAAAFPQAKSRGVVAINHGDRGDGFLYRPPCPAVICEPFFGSSKAETKLYGDKQLAVAQAYAEAIDLVFFGS